MTQIFDYICGVHHHIPDINTCLTVSNSFANSTLSAYQARSELGGIALAPITTSTLLIYIIQLKDKPGTEENKPPTQPKDFELQGDTCSWWRTLRAQSPGEHLLVSIWLVFIFGICWISSQDSNPQRGHGPVQDRAHRLHGELLQNQHPAPAQQGGIHLEGRIFCGCPDQSDRPALHVRKEGVLQTHIHRQREKETENSDHLWNDKIVSTCLTIIITLGSLFYLPTMMKVTDNSSIPTSFHAFILFSSLSMTEHPC